MEELTYTDMKEFELWRNRQMGKAPKASTLNNFSSAWNKLQQVAINKGWLSERVAIPKLTSKGEKGTTALFGIAVTNSKTEAGIGLALARLRLNTQYKRHASCMTCPDFANA